MLNRLPWNKKKGGLENSLVTKRMIAFESPWGRVFEEGLSHFFLLNFPKKPAQPIICFGYSLCQKFVLDILSVKNWELFFATANFNSFSA